MFFKKCFFVTFFQKKFTWILTSAAKTMTPRAKLYLRWSKQLLVRFILRHCATLWLQHFQSYNNQTFLFKNNAVRLPTTQKFKG